MLTLSLLLFLNVEYSECDESRLVLLNQERTYHIDFFNVIFYDDTSRLKACEYLKEADIIEIEEEVYAKDAYYIYVDGKLLQKIIIEDDMGRVNINYVDYLHNFEEKETLAVVKYEDYNRNNHSFFILGTLFFLLCLSIGITLIVKS